MYEYTPLDLSSLPAFNVFLPETAQDKVSSLTPDLKLIAFGASADSTPVGVCTAILDIDTHLLEILHIEVAEKFRNHHIGRTLLAKTQEAARQTGAKTLSFIYTLNQPDTPAIEKILDANHWIGSRPFLIRALFNLIEFEAPLLHTKYKYPKGYTEFLWKDLTADQKKDLLYRDKNGFFFHAVSPFQNETNIEFSNSLGLKCGDRVVGWMITHRTKPDTVSYSALYIEPDLKFKGAAIKLLIDSILLHKQSPTQWATLEIPAILVHASWKRFIKRRLLPYAIEVTYQQQRWHTFS